MITKLTQTTTQAPTLNVNFNGFIHYSIVTVILMMTIVCLFTPSVLFFKQIAANTLYVMLGQLLVGFVFFSLRQEKLMLITLLCCGALCLHLKSSANKEMRLAAVTTNPSLKISHVSLGNAENDYDSVVNYLLNLDADIVSFQELTPDWNSQLTSRLSDRFQYIHTMTRLDQYGMGFFSKVPIESIDTMFYREIPNFAASIQVGGQTCTIISCQLIPPVNQAAFFVIENHFNYLNDYMKTLAGSVIVLGDLHLPPWSSEVQRFKDMSHLQDSRRDINPRNIDGSITLPRIPVEHIFFSEEFDCTSFTEIGNNTIGRVGITGTYQLNSANAEMAE